MAEPGGPSFSRRPDVASWIGPPGVASSLALEEVGWYSSGACPPEAVPWSDLDLMGYDPVWSLGEASAVGPALDPWLYEVVHPDAERAKAAEAWLRPLLAKLLPAVLSGVGYGRSPYVLDWTDGPAGPRYSSVPHSLHPADARLVLDESGDVLLGLVYAGRSYPTGRGFCAAPWRQFGSWLGRSTRRAGASTFRRRLALQILEGRYYERSVDPPRVGYAPPGKQADADGNERSNAQTVVSAFLGLRGGGVATLPSELTPGSSSLRAWGIEALNLPDRSNAWDLVINRQDARLLLASMVPPSSVGAEGATFAGARVPATTFAEVVQKHANDAAQELAHVVATWSALVYGPDVEPPRVFAREIPAARRKLLLDVFTRVADATQRLPDGREVTLGELVDPSILPELGVPSRDPEKAARKPAPVVEVGGGGSQPGPDRSATSGREERRDAAREPEGERGEAVQA